LSLLSMLKYKLLSLYYAFKLMTCSCEQDVSSGFLNLKKDKEITKSGMLNPIVSESSGLIRTPNGQLWTHNDSGAKPQIFNITQKGELLDVVDFDVPNVDWEDIAADSSGNIYIGDFGNNLNTRRDLTIYKWDGSKTESIRFNYADQTFGEEEPLFFDCEAFFWYQDSLYLFTKSWESKEQITKMYVLPATPGEYTVEPRQALLLNEPVTAADISPSKKHFALLTYGKILIFNIIDGIISLDNPLACIKIQKKQTEGLTFLSDSELLISNEQRELFTVTIPLLNNLNI
jgi:hypothetical protein